MSSSSNVTDVGTKDENKMSNSSSSEILKKKTESASKKNTNKNGKNRKNIRCSGYS